VILQPFEKQEHLSCSFILHINTSSGSNLLNTGALLRAGGIGLVVGFVLQIFSAVISVISTSAASGASSSDSATLATALGGLVICLCCMVALIYAAIGAGYSWFVEKSGSPVEMGPVALGGALAAFADGILLGICGVGINYLTGMLNLAAQSGDPAFGAALGGTFGLAGAGLGLLTGVCIYPFVYAILGAAGAAIYAAIASNRSKPQPAAM
jgi:hypothetical protein